MLIEYLKGVGIARFDVDAVNYDSHSITAAKPGPGRRNEGRTRSRCLHLTLFPMQDNDLIGGNAFISLRPAMLASRAGEPSHRGAHGAKAR